MLEYYPISIVYFNFNFHHTDSLRKFEIDVPFAFYRFFFYIKSSLSIVNLIRNLVIVLASAVEIFNETFSPHKIFLIEISVNDMNNNRLLLSCTIFVPRH